MVATTTSSLFPFSPGRRPAARGGSATCADTCAERATRATHRTGDRLRAALRLRRSYGGGGEASRPFPRRRRGLRCACERIDVRVAEGERALLFDRVRGRALPGLAGP